MKTRHKKFKGFIPKSVIIASLVSLGFVMQFPLMSTATAEGPSFNCKDATQEIERVICKSKALSQRDKKLGELYKNVMQSLTPDLQKDVKKEQRSWLKQRAEHCNLWEDDAEACLISEYDKRNTSLAQLLAFDSAVYSTDETLNVLRMTPEGDDVAATRQMVFQFDRPVVPLGRMEREKSEIPITITPSLNCEWRWLNTSALACQLRHEDAMQLATEYKVVMRPGIRSEAGATIEKQKQFSFITARPKVTYSRFTHWLSPGTPLIQVTFNQAVTKDSVEDALYFWDAQNNKQISLIAYPDNLTRRQPWWMAYDDSQEGDKVDDQLATINGKEARRVWVVEPKQELSLDQNARLEVSPGLRSSEGKEKGIEQRVIVAFDTFPEFEFLGIECTPYLQTRNVLLTPELLTKQTKNDGCAPLDSIGLSFSAPVLNSVVKEFMALSPNLNGDLKDYDPWEGIRDWSRLSSPHRRGREYTIWLPERLKAYEQYSLSFDALKFKDEFGRSLTNTEKLVFHTSHREPKLVVNHSTAVLEKNVDTDIPLVVTNIDDINVNYSGTGNEGIIPFDQKNISLPDVEDIAYAFPLGFRDFLPSESGALNVGLTPKPIPGYWRTERRVFGQVTPFQVHSKIGHYSSLVWITDFAEGKPVKNAKITVMNGLRDNVSQLESMAYSAVSNSDGVAELPGLEILDPNRSYIFEGYRRPGLFLKVEAEGDIAILPLDSSFRINGGIYPSSRRSGGHTHAWGTTAQGVYKLGDEVKFKLYVRDQSNRHWVRPDANRRYVLTVYDPQNKSLYKKENIALNEFGSFADEFTVPKSGAVGWYQFDLQAEKSTSNFDNINWRPMKVLVSDFTPSPFSVSTELNGRMFLPEDKVKIESEAQYFAGGPFANADVRVTTRLKPKSFQSKNPQANGFYFGAFSGSSLRHDQSSLSDINASLNKQGQHSLELTLPNANIYYGELMVESAVRDDRGKYVASTARATFVGRDRFVGLKPTQWLYTQGKKGKINLLVVDNNDNVIEGVPTEVKFLRRSVKASRVKGPGNAYLTQNTVSWEADGECILKSGDSSVDCNFTPSFSGSYKAIAKVTDTKGRVHSTERHLWVIGKGRVMWEMDNTNKLDIIPESTDLKVGETARYLVKNPYPGAKALVSIERYGVLESWVQTLETSTPVIEFEVKPDFVPGYYLSVTVMSPRVDKPIAPGNVDLGKPSYRIGYVESAVKDPYKEILIDVTSKNDVYKPRDQVRVSIKVDKKKIKDQALELAVVVVDESVLALNAEGASYYDPFKGFNRLDSLDVLNFSLMNRLIGRQKFEKKGANPGGGGSADAQLRNLFKYVSYWNPSLKPDNKGRATVEFSVPDNLTGWRVLVLGVTPNDFMGMGSYSFKVNRETELRPIMPNQVTEGDSFNAGFTVMNRTDKKRSINIQIDVDGPLSDESKRSFTSKIALEGYEKKAVDFPVRTKGDGKLSFVVSAKDKIDGDALQHSLNVNKRRSLHVAATYGTTMADSISESVLVPEEIFGDVGWLGATVSPSVIQNVDGAIRYVRDYPHMCWEQRLTKVVFANAYLKLKDYLLEDLSWNSAKQDIVKQLNAATNFQAPNGGMTYWVPRNRHVSPYLSAYTALAFHWLRTEGYSIPENVETQLHHYLLQLLKRDDFPSFYSAGMSSSVRAVALAALSEAGKINESDIARYSKHVPQMDLFGKAHYLQAAINVLPGDDERIKTTIQTILGHAGQTGGKFQFSEPWDDSYRYVLATPLRSNCAILSSLLKAKSTKFGSLVGDVPFKLVRSISQTRGNRDHWENTQENVFCTNGLKDYAAIYEATSPNMDVDVAVGDKVIGNAIFNKLSDAPETITRPIQNEDKGKKTNITISKTGEGRLYYSAKIAYAPTEDNANRINAGIEVRREYSVERNGKFEPLKSPMKLEQGELVRVDLFVSLPMPRHFVVVSDPIPGGLEPVNTQLATASTIDAEKATTKMHESSWFYQFSDWSYYGRYFWSFYHKELRHDSANFYSDYLPAGNYHLSYAAQAIASGEFSVMPLRAEEMYDPDVYGLGLPATLEVVK